MEDSNNSSRGISYVGALQLMFIILKLTDTIEWSWFLVLLPTIIGLSILAIAVIILIILLILK